MGQVTSDFEGRIRLCPEATPPEAYKISKEKAGATSGLEVSHDDFRSLVAKSNNASQFDTEASAVLGDWYDDLPETSLDPAKDTCRDWFENIRDAS